jgi:hypothetical protein
MDQGDELSFDDEDERAGRFCDGSSYFIALALIWRAGRWGRRSSFKLGLANLRRTCAFRFDH